ncbi:MAG: hypothetical protein GF392_06215 [Candidatus Omnitrophica bacterium]|nr:hypothetical protein [Candidatus Omnitrophota bacterium]
MKRYVIEKLGAVVRYHLLNDMYIPRTMGLAPDIGKNKAHVEVFLFKDGDGLVERISLGRASRSVQGVAGGCSYFEGINVPASRYFNFFEESLNEEYVFNRALVMSFAVYQDVLQSIFLHCAAAAKGGDAFLFVAPSGGGKTTISRIAADRGFTVLDDEACVVRRDRGVYRVSAFPFRHYTAESGGMSVKGIYFLEKAREEFFSGISVLEAMKRGIPEATCLYKNLIPVDQVPVKASHVFSFMEKMIREVDTGILGFSPGGEVMKCLG